MSCDTLLYFQIALILYTHAENCTHQYSRQPGSTDLCCNLIGHSPLLLQCQVLSNQDGFHIRWHYSTSAPDATSSTTNDFIIDQNREIYNVTETVGQQTESGARVLTSQLSIRGFDEKEIGYYWCSVCTGRDCTTSAPNPSVILFISSRFTSEQVQSCLEPVPLNSSTARCADLDSSIDIIDAQLQGDSGACAYTGSHHVEPTPYTVSSDKTTTAKPKMEHLIITEEETTTAELKMITMVSAATTAITTTTSGGNVVESTRSTDTYLGEI